MSVKLFDLNIEEILENWEVQHAVREVLANALDEQLITNTAPINIRKDKRGNWHVRDFGRGIKIEHFTLKENIEKLNIADNVIGKFGVGLKDALATFSRHGVEVLILSPHGRFIMSEARKHGFDNIITLHIQYDDAPLSIIGTDVIMHGLSDEDVAKAKSLFVTFSDEKVIETTSYGQIIRKKENGARVYINGVLASDEPNFLFSYNITSVTKAMRKRLNRERLNVGRTTYTDRVKAILRVATSQLVKDMLADQVSMRASGTQCDEMQWLEVSQIGFTYLNQRRHVAFVTEQEVYLRPEVIDNLRRDGFSPVLVSDTQKKKIEHQMETGGPELRTIEVYEREFNESFQFKFIDLNQLTRYERRVFELTPKLLELVGLNVHNAPSVRISETMRLTSNNTLGVWEPSVGAIIILRKVLRDPEEFAGTLIHEVMHFRYPFGDVTREFEQVLTYNIGKVAIAALRIAGQWD